MRITGRELPAAVAAILLGAFGALTACSDDAEHDSDAPTTTVVSDGSTRVVVGARAPSDPAGGLLGAVPEDALWVSTDGDDGGAGTQEDPWRTVGHAVESAPGGATIVLGSGTYHESVSVEGSRLTLRAAPGAEVWFDGARVVEGFVASGEGRWRVDGWEAIPGRLEPDSHLLDDDTPAAGWPDQAFLDGEPLRQVAALDEVGPGTFFVDTGDDGGSGEGGAGGALVIGDDPAGRTVEASVLPFAILFSDADRSALAGVGVRRFATPAEDLAAVRVNSDDVTVEDVVVQDCAYAGVSVIGTDALVSQLTARRNGQLGFHARYADRLVLRRSLLEANNTVGFSQPQQAGGAKITASRRVRVEDSLVRDNAGTGLWLDQSVVGATLVRNVVVDNERNGILVELSAKVRVAGNTVVGNGANGVDVVESSKVDLVANTVRDSAGRGVWVVDSDRSASDPGSQDRDRRHPEGDPALSFDVAEVSIRSNVIGHGPPASGEAAGRALIGVEDTEGERSAQDMGVSSDANGFWRSGGRVATDAFSTWAAYPQPVLVSSSLDEHREATGLDRASTASREPADPFTVGSGESLRPAEDLEGAAAAPTWARRELGVRPGHRPLGVPSEVLLLEPAGR